MSLPKLPLLDSVKHSQVDEVIWGHRLRQDQSAWLLVLEMLNVAQACLIATDNDPLIDLGTNSEVNARPLLRIRFRNLLFRFNQKAAELSAQVESGRISNKVAWEKWLECVKSQYDQHGGADYSPLKDRFDDFVEFERAIDLVRSTTVVEPEHGREIYNRYIFPLCPEALYWETSSKAGGEFDRTYNSFTRAGTILHIMLSRSSEASRLRPLLSRFLNRDSRARRLVRQLQIAEPSDPKHEITTPRTYLPYASHPRFDLLAGDFASIFELEVPDNDRLLWLVPLAAMHLSIYHAEVAAGEYLGVRIPVPLVCEILAPRKNIVRELSIESLKENRDFARRAVDRHLADFFASEDWQALLAKEARGDRDAAVEGAKMLIAGRLSPQPSELETAAESMSLAKIAKSITEFFVGRHKREFSDVHFQYGREAGLVALRGTNRYRYAPTDQLLASVVLANVVHEMQLEEFLAILYRRYGMVIGSSQRSELLISGDEELAKRVSGEAFRNNQMRLESRLKSMGMLRRLSDSQAYVINPLQPK